jgi:hypothetical protein
MGMGYWELRRFRAVLASARIGMAVSRDTNRCERKLIMAREIARRQETPPAARLLALAIGAAAVGAVAIGAIAIGRMAIGGLAIRRARFGSLEVDELTVRKLRVLERDDQ